VFVTTRSTQTPEQHAETGRADGIDAVPADVLTSNDNAAASLESDDGPVRVLGEDALARAGICLTVDPDVPVTVVARAGTSLSFDQLTAAARANESSDSSAAPDDRPDSLATFDTGLEALGCG